MDVNEKVVLDSGLSTGGFTDCLLQHGAAFVYGIDVGYGQVLLPDSKACFISEFEMISLAMLKVVCILLV